MRAASAHPRDRPYPLGRGLPPTHFFMMAPASKRRKFSNFSGRRQPRRYDDQRHDYIDHGLPAGNLQVSGGGQGQPQHPGGEFLEG